MKRRVVGRFRLSVVIVLLFMFSSGFSATAALALKEQAPVPPDNVTVKASVLSEHWMEIVTDEVSFNAANVANAGYYTITSSNDADFSGGVHPALVQSRYYPEKGPYCSQASCDNVAFSHEMYRVFLQLPSSVYLKAGKTYTVTVDPSVMSISPQTVAYDLNTPDEAIHVNQVGYLSNGSKVAYMSFWTGQGSIGFSDATTFNLINESTGAAVFSGPVTFKAAGANEKWGGADLYSLDFSSFTGTGTYHLNVPTVGISYSFRIGDDIYKNNIEYTITRGLTLQRDGNAGLTDAITHWSRPAAHLDDAIDQATGQRVDLVGGHMDAGDRGKYPYDVATFAADMLAASWVFPDEVQSLGETLEIPESGNGIPDYLDEVVYELDFLEKAVNNTALNGALAQYIHTSSDGYELGYPLTGATGRVYFDVADGPLMSETLYGAGALAMAYNNPLLKQYYPAAKLNGYLQAAQKAFNAFIANKDNAAYWNSNTRDNYTTGTHPWSDEMEVAAANLHLATGDATYLNWITSELPADMGVYQKTWGWVNEGPWMSAYLSLYEDTRLDATTRTNAKNAIVAWADDAMKSANQQPYGVPMVDSTYSQVGWYFSGSEVAFPMMMAFGVSGDGKYRDQLIKTWNYLLGSNPLSRSYISGLGDPQTRPRWLTHEISEYQWQQYSTGLGGWSEMVPGIPNADLQNGSFPYYLNNSWNAARVNNLSPSLTSYPALYRYSDLWNTTNEFSTDIIAIESASLLPLVSGGSSDTTPPAVPSGLTAAAGDGQVSLNWNANTDSDLAGYNVYVGGVKNNAALLTGTSYNVTGLTNGNSYSFTVSAVDTSNNESAGSAAVNATPKADTGSQNTLTLTKTSEAMTIDGSLNESVWDISTPVTKNIVGTSNNTVNFGAVWDSNYLYVGAKVTDATLISNDSVVPYQDDAIEVYVDGDNSKSISYDSNDRQFAIGYNNGTLWEKNGNTSGVLFSSTAISGGYSVEAAIPWSNLGVTPTAGMQIGLDIGSDDDDVGGGGNRQSQLMWNGTNNNWTDTSAFGVATLSSSVIGVGTATADKTANAITVDGNLNETAWNIGTPVTKALQGTPNNTADFGVLWDNNYLYVGAKVTDATLISNDSIVPYQDDAIEVYVDGDNSKGTLYDSNDRQFAVGYNNGTLWEKNGNTSGVLFASTAISGGYSVEMAIPWSNLGVTPTAGMQVGLDIGNDDDGTGSGGNRQSQLMWNGTNNNWTDTSGFGVVTLSSTEAGDGVVTAGKTVAAVTVDGNLNETAWKTGTPVTKALQGTPNNTADFGVLWDNNYLYVGAKVTDAMLISNDSIVPYQDDAIEVYIDGDNSKGTLYDSNDRQFAIGYNNGTLWEKNGNTSGVLFASTAISGGYSVEMAIPWSNLGVTPTAGMQIGLDIANDDDDTGGGGTRQSQLMWNGTNDNWTNTSAFGVVNLAP